MSESTTMRRRVERMIARRVILDGKRAGFAFNVHNGGDGPELAEPTRDVKLLLETMFATDEEHLLFYRDGKRTGWVQFVYGNGGWDVVSDYSTNLDGVMTGATELADKYS